MNTEATTTEQTLGDEDAAFAAGFDNTIATPADPAADTTGQKTEGEKDGGTLPSDQPQGDGTTTSTEQPQQPAAATDDPFAGLPPAVRDLLAEIPSLRTRTEQAELRAKEAVGRTSSLQSRLDKLSTTPAADPAPAKPRFQKVQELRDQGLPEIADALEEIAAHNQTVREPEPQPTPADTGAQPGASDAELTPDEMALQLARPTWATDLTGTDFQLWLTRQPKDYQQRIASTDKAAEIMAALTQFDQARTAPQPNPTQQRTTRMAAGVLPNGDGRRSAPRGQVQAMTEDEAFEAGFKGG